MKTLARSWGEIVGAALIAVPLILPITPPRETSYSAMTTAALFGPVAQTRPIADGPGAAHLVLGFADRSGSYLANVRVIIVEQRSHGIIANVVTEGPWLDLQIEPGIYDVKAVFQGEERELRNLELSRYDRTLRVLYWDLNVPPTEMQARSLSAVA